MTRIAHYHVIAANCSWGPPWIKVTLLDFANSGIVSDRDRYWSSTPANETLAYSVCFDTKQTIAERRMKDLCVRCVRG
jgi:hypothetical protein